jgi:hypothetical protein
LKPGISRLLEAYVADTDGAFGLRRRASIWHTSGTAILALTPVRIVQGAWSADGTCEQPHTLPARDTEVARPHVRSAWETGAGWAAWHRSADRAQAAGIAGSFGVVLDEVRRDVTSVHRPNGGVGIRATRFTQLWLAKLGP